MDPVKFEEWQPGYANVITWSNAMYGPLRIQAQIVRDIDHDWLASRGDFIDSWQDGAVKNPRAKYDRNVCSYFLPDCTVREHIKSHLESGTTIQEARKLAATSVRDDMTIAADPESAGYDAVAVVVTVTIQIDHGSDCKQWAELANDSLYGIEVKYSRFIQDDDYIKKVLQECTINALNMTKRSVQQIKDIEIAE